MFVAGGNVCTRSCGCSLRLASDRSRIQAASPRGSTCNLGTGFQCVRGIFWYVLRRDLLFGCLKLSLFSSLFPFSRYRFV